MLNDVQNKLEKSWVFGFQNLRVANNSENDDEHSNTIYALDFVGKENESLPQFLTMFNQMIVRLKSKFDIIGACIEFDETPFAIVEFREKHD